MAVCGNKFGKITAKKMSRSGSKDKVKISPSVIPGESCIVKKNFKPSAKLGRVKAATYNLEIKMLFIPIVIITLYFSGIGASEFRRKIEKRWDKERSKTTSQDQSWLIPQPEESSWGDSKTINKVNLVKEIIGYKPRINMNCDAKNMNNYLNRSSKDKLITTKTGLSEGYLPMGAPLLDFLTVDVEDSAGWKYPKLKELKQRVNVLCSGRS